MVRTARLALAVSALALAGLTATTAQAAAVPTARSSAAQVLRTPDAPACGGAGFTLVQLKGEPGSQGCIHTSPDLLPPPRVPAKAPTRGPASAKVPCYGDGQTGPRIQFLYGYLEGERNNTAAVTKQVRTSIAPRMQAVINAQSLGQNLGLRFVNPGCRGISVIALKLPRDVREEDGKTGDAGYQITMMSRFLAAKGYDKSDRKYQVLLDGGSTNACGVGFSAQGSPMTSMPYAPFSEGAPVGSERLLDRKVFGSTQLSLVFGGECRVDTYGLSTVTTELHELFHTLGAVQLDAPHADTGHCFDAPSVMCSGGSEGYGLGVQIPACEKVLVETLDCGMDDYWNPSPQPNTYLSTHLNIAKSQFFGPQPGDTLEPLRP